MLNKLNTQIAVVFLLAVFTSCTAHKKLEVANGQIEQLKEKNHDLENKNAEMQQQLTAYDSRYKSLNTQYTSYKEDCEVTEAKLKMVKAILVEEAEIMHKLEKKLEDAMQNMKDKGVNVRYENGLVHVIMADNLLYKSGSAQLAEEGKKALAPLAQVLNSDYPNLRVIVLGNTDDVLFKKGSDNWTLSTERANGVVRVLRDVYNVDPSRLTAAGKGKYYPIADNTTAEGRAKNRRTDIILNPDLEKLWHSVENE